MGKGEYYIMGPRVGVYRRQSRNLTRQKAKKTNWVPENKWIGDGGCFGWGETAAISYTYPVERV